MIKKTPSAYKNMPKTVRIGCFLYIVKLMPRSYAEASSAMGLAHHTKNEIHISDNLPDMQVANTFLHEITHGIHWAYGLTDSSSEESFTELTANGLQAFFQDNPEATKWMMNLIMNGKAPA